MLKQALYLVVAGVLTLAVLNLGAATLEAAPADPVYAGQPLLKAPPPQEDELPFIMFSSYEWSEAGPSSCPEWPPIFRHGTRVVYNYIPGVLNQDLDAVMLWYELDENGDPISEEPFASAAGTLSRDNIPNGFVEFTRGARGIFGGYLFAAEPGSEDWVLFGEALFGIAFEGVEAPEPGACILPTE